MSGSCSVINTASFGDDYCIGGGTGMIKAEGKARRVLWGGRAEPWVGFLI